MHLNDRYIVRRTASQERFEALWKKRIENKASLKELAEMDEIINRDPLVLQFVLKEMENFASTSATDNQHTPPHAGSHHQTLADKIKSFFERLITFLTTELKLA